MGEFGEKPCSFEGSTLHDLREFPEDARRRAGHELHQVCLGEEPSRWKPMPAVGPGVREIRIATGQGGQVQHRVIYVARFPEAVYVLHAFRKTTEKTSTHDIHVARKRYHDVRQARMTR